MALLAQAASPRRPELTRALLSRYGVAGDGQPPIDPNRVDVGPDTAPTALHGAIDRFRTLSRAQPPAPALRASVAVLAHGPIRTAGEAALELVEAGLTERPLHPRAVLCLASAHGLDNPAAIRRDGLLIPATATPLTLTDYPRTVHRLLRARGITPVPSPDPELLTRSAAALLLADSGIHLHHHDNNDWCWRPADTTSRLSTLVRRMQLGGPQDTSTLLAGWNRAHRWRDVPAPPAALLEHYLASQRWTRPTPAGEWVATTLDPFHDSAGDRAALAATRRGRITSRADILAHAIAEGLTAHTAAQLAQTSPLLDRVGADRYRRQRARREPAP